MNMETIMGVMPDKAQVLGWLDQISGKGTITENLSMPALIFAVVISLLICFFGLKLIKVWVSVLGFLTGVTAGFGISMYFNLDMLVSAGVGLVLGTLFAVLAVKLYLGGIFLLCWLAGATVAGMFLPSGGWIMVVICAVIGLVLALIALKIVEPMVIILTSLHGGLAAGAAAVMLIPFEVPYLGYMIGGIAALIGMVVQFMTRSREVGRMEAAHSKVVRAQESVESEVEAARTILEHIDGTANAETDMPEADQTIQENTQEKEEEI